MNKKILITGSSGNLGKYLLQKFKKKNFDVISLSRKKNLEESFLRLNCDLSRPKEVLKTFKKIKEKKINLDSMILTTGYSQKDYKSLESKENWEKSFNSNFYSVTNVIESYLKVFGLKKIKIIIISSIAGVKIIDAPITYSVSKNALNFYAKYKAKELAKHDIILNIISPGNIFMEKNIWGKKNKKNKKGVKLYLKKNVPLNKFVKPEEIFNLCDLLINEEMKSVTGSNIIIDSGQSI